MKVVWKVLVIAGRQYSLPEVRIICGTAGHGETTMNSLEPCVHIN